MKVYVEYTRTASSDSCSVSLIIQPVDTSSTNKDIQSSPKPQVSKGWSCSNYHPPPPKKKEIRKNESWKASIKDQTGETELISWFRENPCLWNIKNAHFKNEDKKQNLLVSKSTDLGLNNKYFQLNGPSFTFCPKEWTFIYPHHEFVSKLSIYKHREHVYYSVCVCCYITGFEEFKTWFKSLRDHCKRLRKKSGDSFPEEKWVLESFSFF